MHMKMEYRALHQTKCCKDLSGKPYHNIVAATFDIVTFHISFYDLEVVDSSNKIQVSKNTDSQDYRMTLQVRS